MSDLHRPNERFSASRACEWDKICLQLARAAAVAKDFFTVGHAADTLGTCVTLAEAPLRSTRPAFIGPKEWASGAVQKFDSIEKQSREAEK